MILTQRTVSISREIASSNKWSWQHWRAYATERDAWLLMLRVKLRPQRPPRIPVRIVLTSLRRRLIDYGNFVAGAKPIPDCLKRLGYIKDDAPEWFECSYRQVKAPEEMRATIIYFVTPVPT